MAAWKPQAQNSARSIPQGIPTPHLPVKLSSWSDASAAWEQARHLVPEATTIAILYRDRVDRFLCAVVAERHDQGAGTNPAWN